MIFIMIKFNMLILGVSPFLLLLLLLFFFFFFFFKLQNNIISEWERGETCSTWLKFDLSVLTYCCKISHTKSSFDREI